LAQSRGDTASVKVLASEALDFQRRSGNAWATAYALGQLGFAAIEEGELDTAKEQLASAVEIYRQLGDTNWMIAQTRALAWAHQSSGDLATARKLHETNLAQARAAGADETVVGTLGSLAMIAAHEGRSADAVSLARENLIAAMELGSAHALAKSLCRAADLCVRFLGRPAEAARLLGCFEALREQIGVSEAWVARANEWTLKAIAGMLEPRALSDARAVGRKMTIDEGAALALEQLTIADSMHAELMSAG